MRQIVQRLCAISGRSFVFLPLDRSPEQPQRQRRTSPSSPGPRPRGIGTSTRLPRAPVSSSSPTTAEQALRTSVETSLLKREGQALVCQPRNMSGRIRPSERNSTRPGRTTAGTPRAGRESGWQRRPSAPALPARTPAHHQADPASRFFEEPKEELGLIPYGRRRDLHPRAKDFADGQQQLRVVKPQITSLFAAFRDRRCEDPLGFTPYLPRALGASPATETPQGFATATPGNRRWDPGAVCLCRPLVVPRLLIRKRWGRASSGPTSLRVRRTRRPAR